MPLSEAKSLLRSSGEFYVFEHDLEADFEAIKELADKLESFSPIVGLETIGSDEFKRGRRPDSLLLEVTGLAHLFGDESQLARQLLMHCDNVGYLPRVAIADTVAMAWATARYFAGQYFVVHQQPVVLPVGDQETVKQLPVEGLRLEAVTTDRLYQLGIETIGQVQQLPRSDLAMRFGNAIHRRLDQLSGKVEELIVAQRKPAEFVAEQLLEYPTNHRETIAVIIARLVTTLCSQMRSRQRGALEWTVKMTNPADSKSGSVIEFRVNLFRPTATTKEVMPLMEMQLEQVLSPHTRKFRKRKRSSAFKPKEKTIYAQETSGNAGDAANKKMESNVEVDLFLDRQFHCYTTIQIQEIVVSVTSDVLLVQQQRQLFDENPRLDRQSLAHLINRLASRLGAENVVYPMLQSGAQPEYSFRLRPLVDANRKRRSRKTKPPSRSHILARPLRLFHPPKRLKVVGASENGNGELVGHSSESRRRSGQHSIPPALLRGVDSAANSIPGNFQSQRVVASYGPERIETGWWRGLSVCRDYWRVETETCQHFWVYRDLRSKEWFLHGEF